MCGEAQHYNTRLNANINCSQSHISIIYISSVDNTIPFHHHLWCGYTDPWVEYAQQGILIFKPSDVVTLILGLSMHNKAF